MDLNIFNHSKKIAVVTGATGGLGQQLVKQLLDHNYQVVMVARNLPQLEHISLHFGKKVSSCVCDISKTNEVHYLCHEIRTRFGKIDVLVHCAGNINPGLFEDQTDQMIQNQIQVNLTGAIYVTRGLLSLMNKKASIIFLNSLGGLLPLKGSALYSASKFGLRGFAIALAQELRPRKIFVSSIFPAAVSTKMLQKEMKEGGSVLNFCSPPLSVEFVCKTVIKAIHQKRLEYYLPKSDGILIKWLMLKPSFIRLLLPYLEKKGKKGKKLWQEQNKNK